MYAGFMIRNSKYLISISVALLPVLCAGQMLQFRPSEPVQSRIKDPRPQEFGIGASIVLLTYSGDVDQNALFVNGKNAWQVGGELLCQYRLLKAFGDVVGVHLRAVGGYYPLKATSVGYDFRTACFGGFALAHVELFPNFPLRPSAGVGYGFLFFNPKVTVKTPEWDELHHRVAGSEKSTGGVPLELGLTWTVGNSIDVFYQFTKVITFTDNLDGWVANVKDNFQSVSIGVFIFP